MKDILKLTILISTVFSLLYSQLTLNLFDKSSKARCLDGSKYGVYYSSGIDDGNKNLLISFWGGGWCEGRTHEQFFNNCLDRSKDELGSSSNWKKVELGKDFLSSEKDKNPNFWNWTKFDFPYCDGSLHQGMISKAVEYKGNKLYFRGRQNVITGLEYVMSQVDLTKIEKVVITGGSSGAYATFSWINHIKETFSEINPNLKFYGIPDSGFFADYYNFKTKDRNYYLKNKLFYEIVNKEQPPLLKECLAEHPNNGDLCLLTQYFIRYIKVPLLILQSAYDSSNLQETLGLECVYNDTLDNCDEDSKQFAHVFRVYQNDLIKRELDRNSHFSAFLISCVTHCFDRRKMDSDEWTVPEGSGFTIYKAVEKFINNPYDRFIKIDVMEWPGNTKCANLNNKFLS